MTGKGTWLLILTLVAGTGLTVCAHVLGAQDLSAMPAPPWWTPLAGAAAVVGGMVAVWAQHAWGVRLLWAGASVMAVSALPRLPHDLLAVISAALVQMTGGRALFPVHIPWLPLAAHLATLTAATATAGVALREARSARGRCVRCGISVDRPICRGTRLLRCAATVAALAPLPYAALKVAWGLGWRGGVTRPQVFAGASLTTPGFGDTALLAVVGVVLAGAMAWPVRRRAVRWILLLGGGIGAVMLLPVGVVGTIQLVASLLPGRVIDAAELAPWVFAFVYPSFLLWGGALAMTTYEYLRLSRPSHVHETSRASAWPDAEQSAAGTAQAPPSAPAQSRS